MNTRVAKLLKRHHYACVKKGIDSQAALLQVVRLDLVKAFFVLYEIYRRTAVDVIQEFFAEQPEIVPQVLPYLDQTQLHHLGFEVHEPHDLILSGFYRWLPRFSRWLDLPLQVKGSLRFPSSTAFQERVGAYTEMMQIWVGLAERELLIEMFDIFRPRANPWYSFKQTLHFNTWPAWCRAFQAGEHQVRLASLLAGDEIWHYGIHLIDPAAVESLHNRLIQFTDQHQAFRLAYEQPVYNPRDTSLHTKIRNEKAGMEIEFLTQNLSVE